MSDTNPLRELPSVEQLLTSGELDAEISSLSRPLVADVIRVVLQEVREDAEEGKPVGATTEIKRRIHDGCRRLQQRRFTRVINGSGVLIHTNLGRAPLGEELLRRAFDNLKAYSTLEFDLISGKRGQRGSFLSFLLEQLTGATSAMAVNNNAAALFLILNTFANKREVIVSRSELVQIGGGFRIPDIIRRAGARLVEVGTTNQTRLRDYEEAITPKTAIILKVHQSNFRIQGFVEEVTPAALAKLASTRSLISVFDLGSGAFLQTEKFGMEAEPTIQSAIGSGSTLTCFSGDKLLGGTQAGIILGDREGVSALHRNPLYRTLRLDKLTLALLEEVALVYLRGEQSEVLPLWRAIATDVADLRGRAGRIAGAIDAVKLGVSIKASTATPGGGSLPGGTLNSIALVLKPPVRMSRLQRLLLDATPPLIGYINNDEFFLDLRTIDPAEDKDVIAILQQIAACIP